MAALTAAAVLASPLMPAAHADDLKHRRNAVRAQIHRQQAFTDDASAASQAAARRLAIAQTELGRAQRHLSSTLGLLAKAEVLDRRMQAELNVAQANLAQAQQAVQAARQAVREQQARLTALMQQSYQQGDPQLLGLSVLLQATSPQALTTQMQTVDSMSSEQSQAVLELTQERARLVVVEAKVQGARDQVAAKRRAAAANLVVRTRLTDQARSARAVVASLVVSRSSAARSARAQYAADRAQLRRLQARDQAITRAILLRAMRQGSGSYNSGTLHWPAAGPITSPYGWRENPVEHYWGLHDGIDIGAGCYQPEWAAGNGTVISEYYSDVWGNRMFIDLGRIKGHRITVIYNHISSYVVGTGARVARGQTVARVGTTGWSTGCHLHFTVLVDGVAQNPMNWL